MKYYVKLSGNICHYQFADIKDIQVNDIEFGEMDYFELEEQFLLDNCDLENERMIIDDNIKFEVFNEDDKKILEFSYHDINQNDEGSIYFSAEPQYNDEYQNCLGSLNFLKGEGPVFEIETDKKITLEDFSYSVTGLELDDGDVTLMEDFFLSNKKLEACDHGNSWGSYRLVKIWKKSGEIFEFSH